MYAIYYSDSQTNNQLRLFGVVKFESLAVEVAEIFKFERCWNRYQLRFCRSPYLDGSIPPFAVSRFRRLGEFTYYGFFNTQDDARRLADYMKASYPGISFLVCRLSDRYAMRASYMDKEQALF